MGSQASGLPAPTGFQPANESRLAVLQTATDPDSTPVTGLRLAASFQ